VRPIVIKGTGVSKNKSKNQAPKNGVAAIGWDWQQGATCPSGMRLNGTVVWQSLGQAVKTNCAWGQGTPGHTQNGGHVLQGISGNKGNRA